MIGALFFVEYAVVYVDMYVTMYLKGMSERICLIDGTVNKLPPKTLPKHFLF